MTTFVAWLWCKAHGLTVEVVHMSLFRGVCIKKHYDRRRNEYRYEHDARGPCGCHLGPGLCRHVDAHTKADFIAHFQEAYDKAVAIFKETIREFDEENKLLDSRGEPINLSIPPIVTDRATRPKPKSQILPPLSSTMSLDRAPLSPVITETAPPREHNQSV